METIAKPQKQDDQNRVCQMTSKKPLIVLEQLSFIRTKITQYQSHGKMEKKGITHDPTTCHLINEAWWRR